MNAQAAVRRLRVGVVPRWQLRPLTIGYEVAERATEALVETVQKAQEASVLFVKGEWGTGKSHALSVIQEVAQSLNMTCATVTLNPRTAALSHPQRFIGELCATFQSTSLLPWPTQNRRRLVPGPNVSYYRNVPLSQKRRPY